jgi:hypothetical protein
MCNQYLSTVNNFLNDIINENTKLISNIYWINYLAISL